MPVSIFFLLGISAANVMRGAGELLFYGGSLAILFLCGAKLRFGFCFIFIMLLSVILLINPIERDFDLKKTIYFFGPIVQGFLIAYLVFFFFRVNKTRDLIRVLMSFLYLQLFVVLLMIVFYNARLDILNFIYASDSYNVDAFRGALSFRGYGMTRHHLYAFPLCISTIAGLSILIRVAGEGSAESGKLVNKVFLVASSVLICSLNARIGLVIIFGALVLYAFSQGVRIIPYVLLFFVLVALLGIAGADSVLPEVYQKYFSEGLNVLSFDYTSSGTLNDLYGMISLPEGYYSLVFGEGLFLSTSSYSYSDIGIIRAVYFGGFLFLTLIVLLGVLVCRKISFIGIFDKYESSNKSVFIFLLCGFFLALIKGDAYLMSDYSRLIFFLYFWSCFHYNKVTANA